VRTDDEWKPFHGDPQFEAILASANKH
jgi:hypothetical protein